MLKERLLNLRPVLVTIAGLALFYYLAVRTGVGFTVLGLACADICWLLKLGQIISTSGHIPSHDPFSFTLPLLAQRGLPQPFVVYQWLAEVIFWHTVMPFHLIGLMMAGAVIYVLAYLAIPLRACMRNNAPALWSYLALGSSCALAFLRSFVRPEIFTCLNVAIYLSILQAVARGTPKPPATEGRDKGPNWPKVLAMTLIMALWVNLHSGFIYGLVLTAAYAIAALAEDILAKRPLGSTSKTLLLTAALASLATLANPYGLQLWQYLPRLFSTPIEENVLETAPISLADLASPAFWPLISVYFLCLLVFALSLWRSKAKTLNDVSFWRRTILVGVAAASSIMVQRLAPVSSIVMVMEAAGFVTVDQIAWPKRFWQTALSYVFLELAVTGLACLGVFSNYEPSIRNSTSEVVLSFFHPLNGIKFFVSHYDGGRVFASANTADMLELYTGNSSIFMDTRLDAFGHQIVTDYQTIVAAGPNYEKLLQDYGIDWIIVHTNKPLAMAMAHNLNWTLLFHDQEFFIFRRLSQQSK